MKFIFVAFAILLAATTLGYCDEDPMEAQRCVWRCLANARGADDPADNQCVERMCNIEEPAKKQALPAKRSNVGWEEALANPYTRSLAVTSADQAFALTLTCHRSQQGTVLNGFFLEAPDNWIHASLNTRVQILTDQGAFPFEVGGSEDGWVLSDALIENTTVVSPLFVRRLQLQPYLRVVSNNPNARPTEVTFNTPGKRSIIRSYEKNCTHLKH